MDPEKGDQADDMEQIEDPTEDAKASSIANQLMQNPEVLSVIQNKLAGLVDEHNNPQAHMASLPQAVRRRVRAMKSLQHKMIQLESRFYEEVHELECKYAEMYQPLLHQRAEIVNGAIEPSDEQCTGYPGAEDDILAEETESKLNVNSGAEHVDDDSVGVAGFWLQVFKNVDLLSSMMQEGDESIILHLTDVKCIYSNQPMGFSLEFWFSPNEYFTDSVLTKRYELRSEPDEMDPFTFEGPEIVACQGCVINWNKGKNVTVRVIKKKQKHQKSGTTRMVTRHEQQDSFFNFFSPPNVAEVAGNDEGEINEETEALLQADFEIGHFIRERVIPRAVLIYTGEAGHDDDDYEDDDEEGDYDDEDDDDEYDDQEQPPTAGKQDCKQQ